MARTLSQLERDNEALAMLETLLPRRVRIIGEDHDNTLTTMRNMALVLLQLGRFEDAHRTASRGLLLARKVGHEEATAAFVDILSQVEQVLSGGGKGEQKKKSSKPAGETERGRSAESGGGKVSKACAVCMSTVKTKAYSGCKQVYYVSWMPSTTTPMSNLSNLSLSHRIAPFYSTRTVRGSLSIEALEGTQGGLQG
jgi:hypothetical protein